MQDSNWGCSPTLCFKPRISCSTGMASILGQADFAHFGSTTHVPVGEDQVQHLEFARQCADQFNAVHGEVLVRPQTVLCASDH